MLEPQDTLELKELAATSGVSIRTIRFYQQQGLLAAPGQRGPGARYGASDLDRLRLIRLLQRDHLPLAEIRKQLEAMSDDEVARAVRMGETPVERSSAADYARRVLDDAERGRGGKSRGFDQMAALSRVMPSAESPRAGAEAERHAQRSWKQPPFEKGAGSRLMRESWERIEIAPDVELHIRRPLSRPQNRLVERLLAAAQRHLEEEELP